MAAAAAINGRLSDVRKLSQGRTGLSTGAPAVAVDAGHAVPTPEQNDPVDEESDAVSQSAGAPVNGGIETGVQYSVFCKLIMVTFYSATGGCNRRSAEAGDPESYRCTSSQGKRRHRCGMVFRWTI
jgi:hypothetical protein